MRPNRLTVASLSADASSAPAPVASTFSDLVLFRCAELLPGAAAPYPLGMVEEESRLAAGQLAQRLPWETLALPAAQGLVARADLAALPYRQVAPDDADAPASLRGRAVLALPSDFLRLVRLRLRGHGGAVTVLASDAAGLEPGPADPVRGTGHASLDTRERPSAYLVPYVFGALDYLDLPGEPLPDVGVVPFAGAAVALSPVPYFADGSTATLATDAVAEFLYVPQAPDPERLQGTLRDAAAWAAASRLLGQDAETRALAVDADTRAEALLLEIKPRVAGVTFRRGLLL